MQLKLKRFITDDKGHVVMWQTPNIVLSVWIIVKAFELFLKTGHLRNSLEQLSAAVLFAWAYLEVAKGASPFRKVLGVVVLVIVIFGFFKT